MAENEQNVQGASETGVSPVQSNKKEESTFLIILILIGLLAVLLSVPVAITRFNVFGAGEMLRPYLNNSSVFKAVLPPVKDPNNPTLMDREQMLAHMEAQKNTVNNLENNLKELKKMSEIYTGSPDGMDKFKEDKKILEQEREQLQRDKSQLEKDKAAFAEQLKNGDTKAFKAYYEGVNSEVAKQLYAEILREEKVNQEIKEFVGYYEKMDPAYAARIFEQIAGSQINLVANILGYMDTGKASKIIQKMDVKIAGKITDIMAKKNPISN